MSLPLIGPLIRELRSRKVAVVGAPAADNTVSLTIGADLRYHGQQNEVAVTFAHDPRVRRA